MKVLLYALLLFGSNAFSQQRQDLIEVDHRRFLSENYNDWVNKFSKSTYLLKIQYNPDSCKMNLRTEEITCPATIYVYKITRTTEGETYIKLGGSVKYLYKKNCPNKELGAIVEAALLEDRKGFY